MDIFAAVVTVAFMGGGFAWVLYRNQRDYNREKNANPLAPYIIRVSDGWNDAPSRMRNIMLESCGVTDAAHRQMLISRIWHRLPGEVQTALIKLQMLAEFEIANPVLVAEVARNEQRAAKSSGYPTEAQMRELWDASQRSGVKGIKEVLEKRRSETMIISRVPTTPVNWIVTCKVCFKSFPPETEDIVEALTDIVGGFGPVVCPHCGAREVYFAWEVTDPKTGQVLRQEGEDSV